MKYLALDVETANADYSSICQIGIAEFENGKVINKWSSLINPESYFDPFNISIHGIKESDVKNSPTFDTIYEEIRNRLEEKITVHHMPFDRVALNRVCEEYQLPPIKTKWLDSAKITRRTWEQFAYKGYGLKNIADFLDITFEHHDALQDAIAAGLVVANACLIKEMSIEDWFQRIGMPINQSTSKSDYSASIKQEGNPEGSLFGENLVFTGALSLPRKEAAGIAAKIGCNVLNSVTQKTTILVVGTQDSTKLAGYEKSSKHRKTEELIGKGKLIKILSEKDFIKMCNDEDKDLNIEIPIASSIQKETKHSTQKNQSLTIEIDVTEKIAEAFNGLSTEQKELLVETSKKEQEFLDSIPEFNHDDKRNFGNNFQKQLEKIEAVYEDFKIESYEDDDLEILFTIESEIDQLTEMNFDLMKNKITISEFYEQLDSSVDFIESDLEEEDYPKKVKKFAKTILKELNKAKEKITTR
ncbi:exonuclease [Ancylomarina subtilis]|uniref:Exonuclease n=1 Tax=Ancylomarina subtilis TaxID=1639035 RepID=A0A4Q7VJM7_9BACT|nr:exonuclease domain-containing protein [Ancylomarina subtilis]RZT96372.1 exonuclease [Ancylomarina subtilis]